MESKTVLSLIKKGMALREIQSEDELCQMIPMPRTTFYRRKKNGFKDLTLWELSRINKVLKWTPDECQKILGGRRRDEDE